jgi:enamine deaminase RidA (YjgF/YER057c/UK114 family)
VTDTGRHRVSSGSPFEPTIGFSRALRVGDRVWVSGTGPVWADGTCPDDAGTQARRCFDIILAALPAATMVVVAALLDPRWRIEIEVDALIRED